MPGAELSYYDLLGLKPDASIDEVRAAYASLMARIRPNIAQDTASTIRLAAAVKEAFETLGDADKRRAYDETLRGTAAYADIWRRSQQASYLEKRNEWFDQQVRRAQSERQAVFQKQAERKQFAEDFATVAATQAVADAAYESAKRTESALNAAARVQQAKLLRWLALVAVLVALVAAIAWSRGFLGQKRAAPAAGSPSAVPMASATAAQQRALIEQGPKTTSAPVHAARGPERTNSALNVAAIVAVPRAAQVQQPGAPAQSNANRVTAPVAHTRQNTGTRPAFVCRTVSVASVTNAGATVDLSDGSRYQLADPVDRAQAGGWTTGTGVAACSWPASMKRPASLDVGGYTARALPAAIVGAAVASPAAASLSAPACADASITDVADDGYGLALSDGHVYAVDSAGHVTASAWLNGDDVSICTAPARGAKAYTIARSGTVVNASRTLSTVSAAVAPTLCVVRLVSALASDGSRVVFSDGHSYRVDNAAGRAIAAAWAVGERVTVCMRLTGGTVYASLTRASRTVQAVRAD